MTLLSVLSKKQFFIIMIFIIARISYMHYFIIVFATTCDLHIAIKATKLN